MDIAAPIGLILVQVTLILSAALLVQLALVRTAAARHAVLLEALILVGLCPLLGMALRSLGIAPLVVVPASFIEPLSPAQLETIAVGSARQGAAAAYPISAPAVLWSVWLAGAFISLVRLGHGLHAASSIRHSRLPFSGKRLGRLTGQLAMALGGRVPEICITDRATVPIAVGLLRPVVLVPRGLAEQLSDRQLLEVLVHESAHAIRRDPLVGLYGRLLTAMLWFHPLLHLAINLLGRAREDLCDNYALRHGFADELFAHAAGDRRLGLAGAGAVARNRLVSFGPSIGAAGCGLVEFAQNTATTLRPWKSAAIAVSLAAGGLSLACLASPPAPPLGPRSWPIPIWRTSFVSKAERPGARMGTKSRSTK